MAAALSEQRDTIEDAIEPYLIQQGLLQRTPRGRMLTLERVQASGPDASSVIRRRRISSNRAIGEDEL